MDLPRVSIVTACLNQAATVERAVRSVLDQDYPALEYVIFDGGSTDGSVERIRAYAGRLHGFVSEPDAGQADAINRAFARTTGAIRGWLNADDILLPGAVAFVGRFFRDHPEVDVLCGACRYVFDDGRREIRGVAEGDLRLLDVYDPIHQPSCFWRRTIHEHVGPLDVSLRYAMDWDLFLRFARAGARFAVTDEVLSEYRFGGGNKTTTGGEARNAEMYRILCRHQRRGALWREVTYRVLWPLKRLRRGQPTWAAVALSNGLRTAALLALGPLYGFPAVRRATHPFL